MPPHFANHSSAFRVQVRSPYRDMRLLLSEGSVHLSRQFLEKLTDSAIIKGALREALSEVATGSRWLAASPRGSLRGSPLTGDRVRIQLPPAANQRET